MVQVNMVHLPVLDLRSTKNAILDRTPLLPSILQDSDLGKFMNQGINLNMSWDMLPSLVAQTPSSSLLPDVVNANDPFLSFQERVMKVLSRMEE